MCSVGGTGKIPALYHRDAKFWKVAFVDSITFYTLVNVAKNGIADKPFCAKHIKKPLPDGKGFK
jgi:hypothetical protein